MGCTVRYNMVLLFSTKQRGNTMKASWELQNHFKTSILLALDQQTNLPSQMALAYRAQGMSYRRFYWDMFHLVPASKKTELFDECYRNEELNDDNIDTILKKVMKDINIKAW